jgi:molybdenum cofactor cytidylyltransferase
MKVAIVLAAGSSSRMGRPKLDLPVEGKTMSRRVVETLLGAHFDLVRVIGAPGARLDLPDDVRVERVENPAPEEGIASSIRVGLERFPGETEVIAIALADLPLVREATLGLLLRAFAETGSAIVYPEYLGRQGHPVLWAPPLVEELRRLEGDLGAKSLIERHRARALAVPVDDPGVCLDIDTPADYASVEGGRAGSRGAEGST